MELLRNLSTLFWIQGIMRVYHFKCCGVGNKTNHEIVALYEILSWILLKTFWPLFWLFLADKQWLSFFWWCLLRLYYVSTFLYSLNVRHFRNYQHFHCQFYADIEPLQTNADLEEGFCKALLCRLRFRKVFYLSFSVNLFYISVMA